MKSCKGQSTKEKALGNKIKKSLTEYIKSNSHIFTTKELRMIARIRKNQYRNHDSEPENVILKEHNNINHIRKQELKRDIRNRKTIVMHLSGLINKVFGRNTGYEIEPDTEFPIPVIKFRNNTYILLGKQFEAILPKKISRFQINNEESNKLEKDYTNKIKGVWLKWCA